MKHLARPTPIEFSIPNHNKKLKSSGHNQSTLISAFASYKTSLMSTESAQEPSKSSAEADKQIAADDEIDSLIADMENLLVDTSRADKQYITPETKFKDKLSEERINHRRKIDEIVHAPSTVYKDDFQERLKKLLGKPKAPAVVPLTDEENQIVDKLFMKGQSGSIAELKTARVTFKDIYKLYPETWLNDEIINFYFELLANRSSSTDTIPAIHCFNTFFYTTLSDSGYQKVRRWTKRVDIFAKDLLFVPINQSYHWILGVIDMKRKVVSVYDSLGGAHNHIMDTFLDYLQQEHLDKKKTALDISEWKKEIPQNIPQQENMSDCGAFTCTFAERLSRQMPFDFSQKDMVTIRRRMALNIAKKTIV